MGAQEARANKKCKLFPRMELVCTPKLEWEKSWPLPRWSPIVHNTRGHLDFYISTFSLPVHPLLTSPKVITLYLHRALGLAQP